MKVGIFGQGLVATHFAVGLERLKEGEIEPHGVPLADVDLPIKFEDIEIAAAYDVDPSKVGRTVYDIAREVMPPTIEIPRSLKDVEVREGVHLGSMKNIRNEVLGLERNLELEQAAGELADQWKSLDVDVFINVITTEPSRPFDTSAQILEAVQENRVQRLSATQFYAYAVSQYSKARGGAAFVNGIPVFIANDPAFVDLYAE
ncbi:MAG: myo-inositol-1-phosphate synthase, partial [Thermoplasmata archaeon]